MKLAHSLEQRLRQLREDFDSSFARPWEPREPEPNAVLCFSAGGHRFAAALAELQNIGKAGAILPLPSRSPALLGLTVFRARMLPVFSLLKLLNVHPLVPAEICWLLLLRGRRSAAVAVDALDGFAESQFAGDACGEKMYPFAKGPVRHRDHLHVLLDCAALCAAVTRDPFPSTEAQDLNPS